MPVMGPRDAHKGLCYAIKTSLMKYYLLSKLPNYS